MDAAPWKGLLDAGRDDERLVYRTHVGARAALGVALPGGLHPELLAALARAGIERLYSHQAEAIEAAWAGPTIVTTGTASGKSLCFTLPTLETLLTDAKARALYLYPTKALAQDQARALGALRLPRIRPAIYDGDTPRGERAAIRKRANVVLTNPDMLHLGILPNHAGWGDFFANLAVIVIDEAHVYRGVLGSHVANVLRRLRRIAAAYGTAPRVLLASATIANPVELAERLTGLDDIALVDRDGAPSADREIAIWNPPLLDEALGLRRSALQEAGDLLGSLVLTGARTICFIKSRKAVELIARSAAAVVAEQAPELADAITPYRAGYTPAQRRELEGRLVRGELRAVVATDALELGIDIGALDAAICVSFPGTVASLRQMWGRAGRRGRGLALYVAGDDALDQFFCRHPEEFLERPVEAAILDPENEQIYAEHLLCAAHEGPLNSRDPIESETLGPRWVAHAERLVSNGALRERDGVFMLRRPEDYPAARVSLRSASAASVAIIDEQSGELLGTVEQARAPGTVHDGAVYLHLGRAYEVIAYDPSGLTALVRPFAGDHYTQAKREIDVGVERLLDRRSTLGVSLSLGRVAVSEQVIGFQRRGLAEHDVIDFTALDYEPIRFVTQALFYELSDELLDEFPGERLLGSLHAMEHTQIAVLPLLAMCDRWDIGGLSTNAHPQTDRPTVFIYDGHPGGVGIARRGFGEFETLAGDARRLVAECGCADGCPSCVQSPKCGNLNEPLSKAGALELLGRMFLTATQPEANIALLPAS